MDKKEKGTIVRDIAIIASAFGVGTGAPFAVNVRGRNGKADFSTWRKVEGHT
jgi:hypothetical protein